MINQYKQKYTASIFILGLLLLISTQAQAQLFGGQIRTSPKSTICSTPGATITLNTFTTQAFGLGTVTTTALNGATTIGATATTGSCSATGLFSSNISGSSDGDLEITFSSGRTFSGTVRVFAGAMDILYSPKESFGVTNVTAGTSSTPTYVTNCSTIISGSRVIANSPYCGAVVNFPVSNAGNILVDFQGAAANAGSIFHVVLQCP